MSTYTLLLRPNAKRLLGSQCRRGEWRLSSSLCSNSSNSHRVIANQRQQGAKKSYIFQDFTLVLKKSENVSFTGGFLVKVATELRCKVRSRLGGNTYRSLVDSQSEQASGLVTVRRRKDLTTDLTRTVGRGQTLTVLILAGLATGSISHKEFSLTDSLATPIRAKRQNN